MIGALAGSQIPHFINTIHSRNPRFRVGAFLLLRARINHLKCLQITDWLRYQQMCQLVRGKKGGVAYIEHRFNVVTLFWCAIFDDLRHRRGPCAVLLLHRETSAQTTNGVYPFQISIRAVNTECYDTDDMCVLDVQKWHTISKHSITRGASRLSEIQRSLCWATTTVILLHTSPVSPFFNKY